MCLFVVTENERQAQIRGPDAKTFFILGEFYFFYFFLERKEKKEIGGKKKRHNERTNGTSSLIHFYSLQGLFKKTYIPFEYKLERLILLLTLLHFPSPLDSSILSSPLPESLPPPQTPPSPSHSRFRPTRKPPWLHRRSKKPSR